MGSENRCCICGAILGENNNEGIGFECKKALQYAKGIVFNQDPNNRLEMYIIGVEVIKEKFLEVFKNVKFRSNFRKSFFETISTSNRISKKQLEIMENMLSEKNIYMDKEVEQKVKTFKEQKMKEIKVTIDLINYARKYVRK